MAKNEDGPSLKPIEARQAEPGPSVLAILVASVAMAVMILVSSGMPFSIARIIGSLQE